MTSINILIITTNLSFGKIGPQQKKFIPFIAEETQVNRYDWYFGCHDHFAHDE